MLLRGRIVLSLLKRARVNWNWPISWQKYLKIDWSVKMLLHWLLMGVAGSWKWAPDTCQGVQPHRVHSESFGSTSVSKHSLASIPMWAKQKSWLSRGWWSEQENTCPQTLQCGKKLLRTEFHRRVHHLTERYNYMFCQTPEQLHFQIYLMCKF